jgi:hypothetical protein
VGGIKTSEGGSVIKGQNNTYVGKDGNVYRKSDSGWQKYENGSWTSPDRSRGNTATQLPAQGGSPKQGAVGDRTGQVSTRDVTNDLNRESANRAAGNQRTSQWNNQYNQRTSAPQPAQRSAPAATPRGGGGGMRGGGGRR